MESARFFRLSALASSLAGLAVSGCNYAPPPPLPVAVTVPGSTQTPTTVGDAVKPAVSEVVEARSAEKAAILGNVVRLIQTAATNPGGANFGNAIKNLNQYFSDTPLDAYVLDPKAKEFLLTQLPPKQVDDLQGPTWTMPDARHLEDCMMYHGIAVRVAGTGDDLTRVRRVFEWMVRQIQLVPAGSLGTPGLGQAYARPYDVLLRGMAVESEGIWSERGWLFLSLCRQLGLDGGLISYTPPGAKEPIVWCTAILIDKKPYLFDTRIGLPIPGPNGAGVATLDDAFNDPAVLERMDLPGQSPYGTTRAALLASPTKIGVLLDSSLRYFSPRMKLLQGSLGGKNLTTLFRDPAEQRDRWAEAIGERFGKAKLWELPILVETLLFTNPQFVESTQRSLFLFRSELPLLYARMEQLRGETADAVQDYVTIRFAENALMMDKKTPMPREIQQALDVYATYYLGMCHLDQNNPQKAAFFFEKTLQLLPEPGPRQPAYNMFRWGAQANLARLNEIKGDTARAVAFYSLTDPTTQGHGNLLQARDLVWPNPTSTLAPPLPPAPRRAEPIPMAAPAAEFN